MNGIEASPEAVSRILHTLQETDDESYSRCCEALAAFDVRDRLGQIAAPVLAIWGEFDAVTPEALARQIAEGVQRGRVLRVAGASHLAPADRPLQDAAALAEFFLGGPFAGAHLS